MVEINPEAEVRAVNITLAGVKDINLNATKTVLAGPDPGAQNLMEAANPLVPQTAPIVVGPSFDCQAPANSLTVICINLRYRGPIATLKFRTLSPFCCR